MQTEQADTSGRIPLAQQITELLRRDIHTGQLPHGERLPPEREMAQRFDISVGTLRKALALLEQDGLLHRVQGSGNYVHHETDADNVYALFRLELTDGAARPHASLLSVRKMRKPKYVQGIGPDAQAFRFRRIRYLDDTLAALEEIWLDGRYAESINAGDIGDSLYRFYRDELGFRITRAQDRVGVDCLPGWAPGVFKAFTGQSWGFIERLSRDHHGEPAEYSRTWFNPADVRFVAR